MDRPVTRLPGYSARAFIARAWLEPDVPATLGSVTLRPHQRAAIARARAALESHGGALIADDVGLGKTFTALAIAANARRPLVVGPASLRDMWTRAAARTGVHVAYRSYEALSRTSMDGGHDLVVLDEAHHARNTGTSRYRHLAQGLVGARVLMLSATPIHNSSRDLRALVALFLGAVAWAIDDSELATHVIRRERDDVAAGAHLPALAPPQWLSLAEDHDLLDAIVSLPPSVPPSDGGDGGALLAFTLARLWASSHAALRAALIRRMQRARALEDALSTGRHPTYSDLRAWTIGDDATQLAFPELVSASVGNDVAALLAAVHRHGAAIEALAHSIPIDSPADCERALRLREVASKHRGEKIIAFTQFSETAAMLYRLVRDTVRACHLDGRGARVAGGRLTRREAIARFAPRASGAPDPPRSERIDLLITTDLLSEGVNLQDASVVVHLDLPWTSARIDQRVGRSRRLGASHAATTVYAFPPPAGADVLLRQEQRLREKLNAAARITGACGAILPVRLSLMPEPNPHDVAPARTLELLRATLARWTGNGPMGSADGGLRLAHVRATRQGALALVRDGGRLKLVALLGTRVSEQPGDLLEAARHAEGEDASGDADIETTRARLTAWLASAAGAAAAGLSQTIAGAGRRLAMQRIAHIAARAPLHHRAHLAPLAADARRIVTAPYGVGAERILAELAGAPLPDEAWLRAVRAFGEANGRSVGGAGGAGSAGGIDAIILFQP